MDPNRPDDPQYILRRVGKVISVSLETVESVAGPPELGAGERGLGELFAAFPLHWSACVRLLSVRNARAFY